MQATAAPGRSVPDAFAVDPLLRLDTPQPRELALHVGIGGRAIITFFEDEVKTR
jgi:hypothetical protein